MLAIKKIAVTPLPKNEGKIINSFNTSDDKTVNAPSLNAVENYVESASSTLSESFNSKIEQITDVMVGTGDFALLEFNITTTQLDTSMTLNYPEGFTKNNTHVVSILSEKSGNDNLSTYSENDTIRQANGSGFRLFLKSSNMVFHLIKGSSDASNFTAHIKILLLKID